MSAKFGFNCLKVSTVLIFMLFFQSVMAQTDFSELDRKLESAKKELGGFVVTLIYKDGKIIYQKAIGAEFNVKSQMPIAASSNWLTAALVMSFVDQGKLSLDDKVSKFIPIFTKYSKGYITIKDCLAHLTGIESEKGGFFGKKKFATLEEEVIDFASKKEIESNPGLEFRFSNTGMNIAGRILEVLTRRSFEQLMQERITRPLMMRNTSFSSFDAVNPSSGALSTANDYMNFLSMILNKGMFNGKKILSEKAVEELLTTRTTPAMIRFNPKATEGYNYGFGNWIMESDENGKASQVACPSYTGTWPMIDFSRGYACLIFTKGNTGDEKRDLYMSIKNVIDVQLKPIAK